MSAVKIPFRLKGPDLDRGDTSFQSRFQARVDRPLDDLDLDEFFRDLQTSFRPGDQVRIVAYKDRSWQQVMEWRTAIITSNRQEGLGQKPTIRAQWDGDYGKIEPQAQAKPAQAAPLKLSVKKEFGGGYTVQDEKGHVVERLKTKQEAEDYIANLDKPAPVKAA